MFCNNIFIKSIILLYITYTNYFITQDIKNLHFNIKCREIVFSLVIYSEP